MYVVMEVIENTFCAFFYNNWFPTHGHAQIRVYHILLKTTEQSEENRQEPLSTTRSPEEGYYYEKLSLVR